MPSMFAVKIVCRLKVLIIFCQSDDLALHSRLQLRLALDKFVTCSWIVISRTILQLWHSTFAWRQDLCMPYAHFDYLHFDPRSQRHVGRGTHSATKQALSVLGKILFHVNLTLKTNIWHDDLVSMYGHVLHTGEQNIVLCHYLYIFVYIYMHAICMTRYNTITCLLSSIYWVCHGLSVQFNQCECKTTPRTQTTQSWLYSSAFRHTSISVPGKMQPRFPRKGENIPNPASGRKKCNRTFKHGNLWLSWTLGQAG